MLKQNKGITLIALIVTIIVLLVLAGVAINLSMGENGIITKAKTAVDKYKQASQNEQLEIGKIENQIDEYSSFSRMGGNNINYSTVEQNTGLKWIDNKPIYQKTIQCTVCDVTNITYFPINEKVNEFIDFEGVWKINGLYGNISYASNDGGTERFRIAGFDNSVSEENYRNTICLYSVHSNTSGYVGATAYVTIRYTKV